MRYWRWPCAEDSYVILSEAKDLIRIRASGIHPDEILADNFVRLVMGDKDVPTPRIIDEMRKLLRR